MTAVAATDFVIQYCERLSEGSEPFNIVSNTAFLLVAAAVAWRQCKRAHADPLMVVMATLCALLAFGSAAFHAWPAPATWLLDIVPIVTLMLMLLWQLTVAVAGFGRVAAGLCALALLGSTLLSTRWAALLNGSLFYMPCWIALCVLVVTQRHHPQSRLLFGMLGLFTLAIVVRSADLALCGSGLPHGVHWLWHVLTAIILAMSLLLVERIRAERTTDA